MKNHYILYMRRLGKEYGIDVNSSVTMKYGSVNRNDPRVVYLSGKCWVSPRNETDYEKVAYKVKQAIRRSTNQLVADGKEFDKDYILDFYVNLDELTVNDSKFMSFDIYIRQAAGSERPLAELRDVLSVGADGISSCVESVFNENGFSVGKTKKSAASGIYCYTNGSKVSHGNEKDS